MLRKRSIRVLHTLASSGPVADLEVGVEDEVGGAGLETRLSILTFIIFSTVPGVGVQFIAGTWQQKKFISNYCSSLTPSN